MGCETEKRADGYVYQKTLLYIYPYMGRMAEAIGRAADVKAALSYRIEDTRQAVEDVLAGIWQRGILLELKREMREMLKEFSPEEGFLLEYKFFRRKGRLLNCPEEIWRETSERTVYRRQKRILKKFSAILARRGLDERWFCENMICMDWVEAVYRKVEAGKDVRVAGKHKRSPFGRRRDQGNSSLENPNSSAVEDCGCG